MVKTKLIRAGALKRATVSVSLMVGAAAFVGCSGSNVKVTQLPAGSSCPNGGVQIVQDNQTQTICNGANGSNGYQTLVETTQLAVGDSHCPSGGVEVQSGLDNGAGGGTAGDGKLESGEVTSTQYVCNGSSNGSTPSDLTPPPGSDGTNVLLGSGGAGSDGGGGQGGNVTMSMNYGTNGGAIKLFRTGSVDAGFTFPSAPSGDFGTNKASVSGPVVITAQSQAPSPALDAGSLFTYGNTLYVQYADGGAAQVTGLDVAAAAVVTVDLPLYIDGGTNPNVTVNVPMSCHNAGTITVQPVSATQAGNLQIDCGDYYGAQGSSLVANGAAGSVDGGVPGGNGGSINLQTSGALLNQGTVDVSGGSGPTAGNGGSVQLASWWSSYNPGLFYNTGSIKASGGSGVGAGSSGASGGRVTLGSNYDFHNSGTVDVRGGNGSTASGSGGSAYLEGGYNNAGLLTNSGDVLAQAGAVDPSCTTGCIGGNGGYIEFDNENGDIVNTGKLLASGAAVPAGVGGSGGSIKSYEYGYDEGWWGYYTIPSGSIRFGASMDVSGGAGQIGGRGGSVYLYIDPGAQVKGGDIAVYGVPTVHLEGGNGTTGAGSGGYLDMYNAVGQTPASCPWCGSGQPTPVPGGSVVNYADVFVNGGSSSAGSGGSGGTVDLETQYNVAFSGPHFEFAINAGALNMSGGSGATRGGYGGRGYLYGLDGATNSGAWNLSAGSTTTSGNGTWGGECNIVSDSGPTSNSGNITANGGNGLGASSSGGGGRQLWLIGGTGLTNSGTLSGNGGNADATTGTGGNGSAIYLFSQTGTTTNTVSAPEGISVKGGTAKTPGKAGSVQIDGSYVTASWTH